MNVRKGEPSLKLLLSVPRIWVSQPGISHSNANGTPRNSFQPKTKEKENNNSKSKSNCKAKTTAKRKTQNKVQMFSLFIFAFALLFFYVHLWQNANSNVQQQTTRASRRDVWSVCNVCVLHRCSPSPLLFATCHFAAAWVLSLLLLARQFEQPTNCI